MEQDKTGKYFKYAIGEIVLVVLGILIALSINNWNEKRKDDDQIKKQLNNLIDALNNDLTALKESYDINQWRFSSFQYLLNISGHEPLDYYPIPAPQNSKFKRPLPENVDRKFINMSFSWFHRGFSQLVFNRSAIMEFNNTGLFPEITNDELKDAINEYYLFIDWRFGSRDMETRYKRNDELVNYIQNKYDIWTSDISDLENPINLLKEDDGLILRLKSVIRETHWHSTSVILAFTKLKKLITEIELFLAN